MSPTSEEPRGTWFRSMQARMMLSMVVLVLGALVLVGFGSIVLQNHAVLRNEEGQLRQQAQTIASNLDSVRSADTFGVIAKVGGVAGVSVIPFEANGQLLVGQKVQNAVAQLPSGLTASQFPPDAISAGRIVTGRVGNTLFVGAPTLNTVIFAGCQTGYSYLNQLDKCIRNGAKGAQIRRALVGLSPSGSSPVVETATSACPACTGALVVVTRGVDVPKSIIRYFVLAGAVALFLALLVAASMARRITGPVRRAVQTTRKIAEGDLDVHLETMLSDYPEMGSLADSLNVMTGNLRDARDLQRNFLMSVSHDLRTPLTSIQGYAEAISDGMAEDPRRAAEVIAAESQRLERLVGDLLDLAKLSAHAFSMDLRKVDVAEVVTGSVEGFRPTLESAGIELVVHAPPIGGLSVAADPDRLAQVIANLVDNAYKFARGRVTVIAGQRDGFVVIAVEDDGPGIPAEDLPRIFERLYSPRREARRSGSGLGLAIVAELCQAMGAAVRADSPIGPEGGTVMVVTMRLHPPEADAPRPFVPPAMARQ